VAGASAKAVSVLNVAQNKIVARIRLFFMGDDEWIFIVA
jgi:hypothetical protein